MWSSNGSSYAITEKIDTSSNAVLPTHSPIVLRIQKSEYVLGEIIHFDGNTKSNTILNITLNDPDDVVIKSTLVSSNEDGYFSSTLDIPENVKDEIWNVVAESGADRLSVEITILPITQDTDRNNVTSHLLSPLKQIKAGTQPHNVACNSGLELAKKKGGETSACVKLDTKIE